MLLLIDVTLRLQHTDGSHADARPRPGTGPVDAAALRSRCLESFPQLVSDGTRSAPLLRVAAATCAPCASPPPAPECPTSAACMCPDAPACATCASPPPAPECPASAACVCPDAPACATCASPPPAPECPPRIACVSPPLPPRKRKLCNALTPGVWTGEGEKLRWRIDDDCEYSVSTTFDFLRRFAGKKLLLIGDSTTREIAWDLYRLLLGCASFQGAGKYTKNFIGSDVIGTLLPLLVPDVGTGGVPPHRYMRVDISPWRHISH